MSPIFGSRKASGPVPTLADVYRGILAREPDAEGIRHYTEALSSGMSWAEVIAEFVDSSEFRDRISGPVSLKEPQIGDPKGGLSSEVRALLSRFSEHTGGGQEQERKDKTVDEIMKRIRAKLGRDSSIAQMSAAESASSGHTAATPTEMTDFGKINTSIETAEKRSLVSNTLPGAHRYPVLIRPFTRLLGKVILFLGQPITKPQEHYNVAAIQAIQALKEGVCLLAERQAILLKELSALNRRVTENLAYSEEQSRNLLGDLTRIAKLIADNLLSPIDDALYVALENKLRGSRQEIKDRARVYLPAVARALSTTGGGTVLDLGCGRGEWLELLREHNISALGVDSNREMVGECRSYSLLVEHADLMEYLKQQRRDEFAAITGFHVIEHLRRSVWTRVLDETLRILKPGGVAIFETPNPENVLVGSHTFYCDPTHRNPLPSAMVQFIAGECGFDPVEIMQLHPADPENLLTETTPIAAKFNYHFYGPRDYAIVAWKK